MYGQTHSRINLNSAQYHIGKVILPNRRTADLQVIQKMRILAIGAKLYEFLDAIERNKYTVFQDKWKIAAVWIHIYRYKNIQAVARIHFSIALLKSVATVNIDPERGLGSAHQFDRLQDQLLVIGIIDLYGLGNRTGGNKDCIETHRIC